MANSLLVSIDYLAGADFDDNSVKFKRKDIIDLLHQLNKLTSGDIAYLYRLLMPYVREESERQKGASLG